MIRLAFTVCIAVSILLHCSEYNPFADVSNARAHATFSFSEYDTLSIFATESLEVVVTVGDLVDSVLIQAPRNRFWQDTTLYPPFQNKTFTFRISIYQMGATYISVTTCLQDHDFVEYRYNLFAKSPLRQMPLSGNYTDTLHLSTDAVKDRDVYYNWDFGDGVVVTSVRPDTSVVLRNQTTQSTGYLYLTEIHDGYESNRVPFSFDIRDLQAPLIVFLGENRGNDTIITGDAEYPFKVLITDVSGSIRSAKLNGGDFTTEIMREYGMECVEVVNISAEHSPQPLTVTATDNSNLTGSRTFWLFYDPDAPSSAFTNLRVYNVADSIVQTTKREHFVFGEVEDYYRDSLILRYKDEQKTVRLVNGMGEWIWDLALSDDTNRVCIQAQSREGDSLAQVEFTILYDHNLIDTVNPNLFRISIDGMDVKPYGSHFYTSSDSVEIQVIAFDEGSGIESLFIADSPAINSEDEHVSYTWRKKVDNLSYGDTVIEIEAVDSAGNAETASVCIIKNQLPQFNLQESDFPDVLFVDSLFVGRVAFYDHDNILEENQEQVFVYHSGDAQGLSIDSASGSMEWRPSGDDVGEGTDTIYLRDRYQQAHYVWNYRVEDLSMRKDTVKILTSENDFPEFIEVGVESLYVPLQVVDSTGCPPFFYEASFLEDGRNVLLNDSVVSWKPDIDDTGTVCLYVGVVDSCGQGDTISPCINVLPPNRPCSLSGHYSGKIDSLGIYDLIEAGPPETLTVTIHDDDFKRFPQHEHFSVMCRKNGAENRLYADSNGIVTMLLSPLSKPVGYDTLLIRVTDSHGHSDTLQRVLYYGKAPGKPYNQSPGDSLFIDSTVLLSWSCDNPDPDELRYDIFLGVHGDLQLVGENIPDTQFQATVRTTGTYYWKVVATDGKNRVESPLRQFSHENLSPVRFMTKEEELLTATVVFGSVWTYKFSMEGGKPPYTVCAYFGDSVTSLDCDEASISWIPSRYDVGIKPMMFIVTDAYKNKDTLNSMVCISTPFNSTDRVFEIGGLPAADTISVDTTQPKTVAFTIVDNYFAYTKEYEISIISDGITISRNVQNGNIFELLFYKHPEVTGFRSVKIVAKDISSKIIEKTLVIDYGP